LVNPDLLFVDGTKIKANASLHRNLTLAEIEEQIELIMAAQETLDASEDKMYGTDKTPYQLPEDWEERLAQLQSYKEELDRDKESDKPDDDNPNGPTPPQRTLRKRSPTTDRVNQTDPESRRMHFYQGGSYQGYNCGIIADKNGLIVSHLVSQRRSDVPLLKPLLLQTLNTLQQSEFDTVVADGGFFSDDNVLLCNDIADLHITNPTSGLNKLAQPGFAEELRQYREGTLERPLRTRAIMALKCQTERGKKLAMKRKTTIERCFATMKCAWGYDKFLTRSLKSVGGELAMICLAMNIKSLFNRLGTVFIDLMRQLKPEKKAIDSKNGHKNEKKVKLHPVLT
jgi:hypothetical protein